MIVMNQPHKSIAMTTIVKTQIIAKLLIVQKVTTANYNSAKPKVIVVQKIVVMALITMEMETLIVEKIEHQLI